MALRRIGVGIAGAIIGVVGVVACAVLTGVLAPPATVDGAAKLLDAVTKFISVLVWPIVAVWALNKPRPRAAQVHPEHERVLLEGSGRF